MSPAKQLFNWQFRRRNTAKIFASAIHVVSENTTTISGVRFARASIHESSCDSLSHESPRDSSLLDNNNITRSSDRVQPCEDLQISPPPGPIGALEPCPVPLFAVQDSWSFVTAVLAQVSSFNELNAAWHIFG